ALEGVRTRLAVVRQGNEATVIADDGTWRLHYIDPLAPRAAAAASGGRLTAPMPGKVAQVLIAAGGGGERGPGGEGVEAGEAGAEEDGGARRRHGRAGPFRARRSGRGRRRAHRLQRRGGVRRRERCVCRSKSAWSRWVRATGCRTRRRPCPRRLRSRSSSN